MPNRTTFLRESSIRARALRGVRSPTKKESATNQEKVRSLDSKNLSLRFVQTGAREDGDRMTNAEEFAQLEPLWRKLREIGSISASHYLDISLDGQYERVAVCVEDHARIECMGRDRFTIWWGYDVPVEAGLSFGHVVRRMTEVASEAQQ